MRFKQKMLLMISLLIISGFLITSISSFSISRQAAIDAVQKNQLPLTSDNIFSEVQRDILRPRIVSSFMANDTFLKDWIVNGEQDIDAVTRYLKMIQEKYGAFTTFLISDKTGKYYHSDGLLKTIKQHEPRDEWFYRVKNMSQQSEINLDPDMINEDMITIYINVKIHSHSGEFIGVTGVGLNLQHIQDVLNHYREKYGNNVYFLDKKGNILLHGESRPFTGNISQQKGMSKVAEQILSAPSGQFKYTRQGNNYLLHTRYIEELDLILCVEADENQITQGLIMPLVINLAICLLVTGIVLWLLLRLLNRYQSQLETIAWQDPLTGLLNRRSFMERYLQQSSSHTRSGRPMTLLLLDVDNFKQINDSHGHLLGDQVMIKIADVLKTTLRPSDILARWGGDEFIALLPETNAEQAILIGERLRSSVTEDQALLSLTEQAVTVSIGTAVREASMDMEAHIMASDEAMYAAKQAGRNAVFNFVSPEFI
ncbi:MAG: diguanylate cyclase [Amphritea sp.]